MSDMVDKVAKALFDAHWHGLNEPRPCFSDMEPDSRFYAQARIAIAAMREPTGDMKRAGACMNTPGSMASYQAMIDEALK